mgnify:CR=1 FL=1
MNYLVVGGAGYIGSHMVKLLQEFNHNVVIVDNFSTGNKWAVDECEVLEVDLLDEKKLYDSLRNRTFDTVFHFAAKSIVSESQKYPHLYYENNVKGTMNLLKQMLLNNIENIVFSSTAAVYGNPQTNNICENHPKEPINVYGSTKLAVENLIKDYCISTGMNGTCFRYFNAAGAHKSGHIGEKRQKETHLIPNILEEFLLKQNNLKVFGNDYKTPDGTCIRDYIHVDDIAHSHLIAAERFDKNKGFEVFNIGNETGYSVMEIIKSCEQVVESEIDYRIESRRSGDPDILIADCTKAKEKLEWQPKYNDINDIVGSAWKFHKNFHKQL